jgi:hypothetical protein
LLLRNHIPSIARNTYRLAAGGVARNVEPEWLPAPDSTGAEDPGYRIQPSEIVDLLTRLPRGKEQAVALVSSTAFASEKAGELLQTGVYTQAALAGGPAAGGVMLIF